MSPTRRYKQLRFPLEGSRQHYHYLPLRFRLGRLLIEGQLHGDCADWCFISHSPSFLKMVPGGVLYKYMLWIDEVPANISLIYNAIADAAATAGYTMREKED